MDRLEQMKEIEVELRRYCHERECKQMWRCPTKCDCNPSLGLHTAIAWEAADSANLLYAGKISKWWTETMKGKVGWAATVTMHHSSQYPRLYGLLLRINRLIYEIEGGYDE